MFLKPRNQIRYLLKPKSNLPYWMFENGDQTQIKTYVIVHIFPLILFLSPKYNISDSKGILWDTKDTNKRLQDFILNCWPSLNFINIISVMFGVQFCIVKFIMHQNFFLYEWEYCQLFILWNLGNNWSWKPMLASLIN